jgi:hypothetical protein
MAVNVVPDSQRRQKMNPHLTAMYISSFRYSAHVKKALSTFVTSMKFTLSVHKRLSFALCQQLLLV